MAWPYLKHIMSTDDQTEISGTQETIRKDRKLQKLNRIRCEKPLRDELGKLRTEKSISEKNYSFERHYYEAKLKDFKGKRLLSAVELPRNKIRNESSLNPFQTKDNAHAKTNNALIKNALELTSFLPRNDLKWSLNDPASKIEQKSLVVNKSSSVNAQKLPSIYNRRLSEAVARRQEIFKRGCLERLKLKRPNLPI